MDKRDKRRYNMAKRLRNLNETFSSERDVHYSEMLHSLQCSLYALHVGNHPEYLEKLADLEEQRDNRLVELYLWEKYQTEQAELQHKLDLEHASSEYSKMLQLVKDKLRARLEGQRKRLSEDRALYDVSNEHTFFSTCSTSTAPTRYQLSTAERRSLRRRDYNDDISGVSGNEGRSRRAVRNTSATAASDVDTATDRDLEGLFQDFDSSSTRHVTKSFQGPKVMRADEVQNDLGLINMNVKRMRKI